MLAGMDNAAFHMLLRKGLVHLLIWLLIALAVSFILPILRLF